MYIYKLTMCSGYYAYAYILHNKKYTKDEFKTIYENAYKIIENKIKTISAEGYYCGDGLDYLIDVMCVNFGFKKLKYVFSAEIADDVNVSEPCIADTCIL